MADRVVHVLGDPGTLSEPLLRDFQPMLALDPLGAIPAGRGKQRLLCAVPADQPREYDEEKGQ